MTTIGGATRLVALLGQPVAGSLSPRMQNAAFAARGLDWAYVALDVAPRDLADVVRGIAAAGFAGANVTMPHKGAAAELCDALDELSRAAGAVNTLVLADGRISGFNTDGPAVVSAVDAAGKRALVLGRGGAGRVVAAALDSAGAQTRLVGRSDADWPPDGAEADILVNATPVRDELLVEPRPGQQVVDLAYAAGAGPTALVSAARAAGCPTVDGAEILVRQGAASFELWTGLPGPVEVMRAAVFP
ncbi:MAG TPA: shikimate dehydrogenase [Gaiellaceae bacterium]